MSICNIILGGNNVWLRLCFLSRYLFGHNVRLTIKSGHLGAEPNFSDICSTEKLWVTIDRANLNFPKRPGFGNKGFIYGIMIRNQDGKCPGRTGLERQG